MAKIKSQIGELGRSNAQSEIAKEGGHNDNVKDIVFTEDVIEEQKDLMEKEHFELTMSHKRVKGKIKEALYECLVEGKKQIDVAPRYGIDQSQLSRAIRASYEAFTKLQSDNDLELKEILLPKQLMQAVILQQDYILQPILEKRNAKKEKRAKAAARRRALDNK